MITNYCLKISIMTSKYSGNSSPMLYIIYSEIGSLSSKERLMSMVKS
jgi:hypothetical protein